MDLQLIWFVLLGVLLAGYAILDGFDFGVGTLHFLGRNDTERRILINSIGPLWDGNEVWLVTFGGALFAAFPEAYATVFSGFYMAFMLVLLALILRAVSLEFRSKRESPLWRRFWDGCFFGASLAAPLLFGVSVGAAMVGVSLDDRGIFAGRFLDLLQPYTLAVGAMTVAMFTMHGAIYLYLKTDGDLQQRIHVWMWRGFAFFLITYLLTTIMTLAVVPRAVENFRHYPWAWGIVVLNALAIANIPRAIHLRRPGYAFVSSCATVAALVFLFGMGLFPNLVTSNPAPANSLTIYNAASSPKTLGIMLIVAAIGMPFVLTYTGIVYWTFRGKVNLDHHSY
jgi:cytochrome d ubiquinol oxidase subunit II